MEAVDVHRACRLGDTKGLLRALYTSPESVNSLDPKLGWPPLYRAVICNQFHIAKLLLEQGADPNLSNRLGESPLHQAADSGLSDLTSLLLKHQADPNLPQKDGETPLHRAAEKGRTKVAELLLQAGACVNARSKSTGKTPMHLVVEYNQVETAMLLLLCGGSKDVPDSQGRSPLDMAPSQEMLACFERAKKESLGESEAEDFLLMAESPTVRAGEVLSIRTSGSHKSVKVERMEPRGPLFIEPETCNSTAFADLTRTYSFGAEVRRSTLAAKLEPYKLSFLASTLAEAGLDTIEALVAQLQSKIPLTEMQLQAIGVEKPGHCARLLAAIEATSRAQIPPERHSKAGVFECCQKPMPTPSFSVFPPMEEWLAQIGLQHLYPVFQETGYDHLESVLALSRTRYALTDELLCERLGIQSEEERMLLLAKVQEDAHRTDLFCMRDEPDFLLDQSEKVVACRTCVVM